MSADDVPRILGQNCRALASIYNNIFGGNLSANRRENLLIFEYLERFQIGRETSNRFDNILIFGELHEELQEQFHRLVGSDKFYGADVAYEATRRNYIEGADERPGVAAAFLYLLVSQRRRLFFTIANDEAEELKLWDLTVFKYGGEYLDHVLGTLRKGGDGSSQYPRTDCTRSQSHFHRDAYQQRQRALSSLQCEPLASPRISVSRRANFSDATPRWREDRNPTCCQIIPNLVVCLGGEFSCKFQLTLTRYEYLSRVAEGAMPNSFSKECFEDVMAFKSRLMRELEMRDLGRTESGEVVFRVVEVDANGAAREERIGVLS